MNLYLNVSSFSSGFNDPFLSTFSKSAWLNKNLIDDNVKILVGIDSGFSGADYIIDRIESDYKCIDKIYDNLVDMLTEALKFL